MVPDAVPLIVLNFAHTAGPLAVAIPTWRNSLVFHSLDKVTSVFVHGLPPLLLFASRWYPAVDTEIPDSIGTAYTMGLSLLGYFGWQLFYLVQTEVFGRRALASNDKMMTSIRWLTTPDKGGGYSGMAAGAMAAARSCGFFAPGEPFDSEHWKTKVVFMLVQLIYTAVTLLPIPWLWQSFELHLAYLLCIYTVCVWNGGSYYIEVFSKAYRKQFEGDRDQRRRAVFESFGAPEGERPKRTPSVGDVAAAAGVAGARSAERHPARESTRSRLAAAATARRRRRGRRRSEAEGGGNRSLFGRRHARLVFRSSSCAPPSPPCCSRRSRRRRRASARSRRRRASWPTIT